MMFFFVFNIYSIRYIFYFVYFRIFAILYINQKKINIYYKVNVNKLSGTCTKILINVYRLI